LTTWEKEGFKAPEGKGSLYSAESQKFAKEVLKVDTWYTRITTEGYQPVFQSPPQQYRERNNRSAQDNIEFVREKVQQWEQEGYVTQLERPSLCVNPLSVVTKVDPESGKTKKRVCLDCSRYVNKLLVRQTTNLEDIYSVSGMEVKEGFSCVFDLENQYFHVQLAPEAKKYFGFSLPGQDGKDRYYVFNIMIYGISTAVAVVTRLTKPIQSLLHDKGIRASIYVDDGRICGSTKEETESGMRLAVQAYILAGWNIQWKKTDMVAYQKVRYLGFCIDLNSFTYTAEAGKEREVKEGAEMVCSHIRNGISFPVRQLARLLGKMAAMRVSHGNIVYLCTRSTQHQMGVVVMRDGWDSDISLSARAGEELGWVIKNFSSFNGRGIRDETGEELVHSLQRTRELQAGNLAGQASDAAAWSQEQSTSWTVPLDGKVKELEDYPGGSGGPHILAGFQEMETIYQHLKVAARTAQQARWTRWVWLTSSRNCHHFITKGSRQQNIQDLVLAIKREEAIAHIELRVIWVTEVPTIIAEADSRSIQYSSTDEWGASRQDLQAVIERFRVSPTVDAFASRQNTICPSFYSKWPQLGGSGIDFFCQHLDSQEVYFCCPPVTAAAHMQQRLRRQANVTAIIVLPAWRSALHWAMLRNGESFIPEIKDCVEWEGHCQDSGRGESLFSRGSGIKLWAGLYISGKNKGTVTGISRNYR